MLGKSRFRQQYSKKIRARCAGLGLKAVWYGAEQFGNVLGLTKKRQTEINEAERPQQVCFVHSYTSSALCPFM